MQLVMEGYAVDLIVVKVRNRKAIKRLLRKDSFLPFSHAAAKLENVNYKRLHPVTEPMVFKQAVKAFSFIARSVKTQNSSRSTLSQYQNEKQKSSNGFLTQRHAWETLRNTFKFCIQNSPSLHLVPVSILRDDFIKRFRKIRLVMDDYAVDLIVVRVRNRLHTIGRLFKDFYGKAVSPLPYAAAKLKNEIIKVKDFYPVTFKQVAKAFSFIERSITTQNISGRDYFSIKMRNKSSNGF
ncbi:hypothetical protein CDAR_235971 [Caerostris darwini]|uniref:Uncharacterized protein n=1 Tax=Caerostris darwini TaxID=1538125 RepID=A0AAV4UGA0_9ARAC|nr:hypothetical protein CDAR_235971 [Caerostris darwini]